MLKYLPTPEDYWNNQWFSSFASLFKIGTFLTGKSLLSLILRAVPCKLLHVFVCMHTVPNLIGLYFITLIVIFFNSLCPQLLHVLSWKDGLHLTKFCKIFWELQLLFEVAHNLYGSIYGFGHSVLQAHFLVAYEDRRVVSSRLTGGTVLCPWARRFTLCLVLVQPRKTGNFPDMTERLLMET